MSFARPASLSGREPHERIATHLRLDDPLFSHVLFPTYVAALIWGGLHLRDARVRALVHAAR